MTGEVWRPSKALLKDALIHRHDIGSVLVRRLNVLRLEFGVVFKELFLGHPRPQLPENVLNGQARPFGSSGSCARRARRNRLTDVGHPDEAVAETLILRPERAVTKQPRATPWDLVVSSRRSPERAPQILPFPGVSLVICDRRTSKPRTKRGGRLRKLSRPFRAFLFSKFLSPGRCPGLHC